MARRSRHAIADLGVKRAFDAAECCRVVTEFQRQRKNASEYAGSAGGVMKAGCEKLGIERRALSLAATLHGKEPGKRAAFLRDFLRAAHGLGHFDQIDAFDDLLALLEQIAAECRGRDTPATSENNAQALNALLAVS